MRTLYLAYPFFHAIVRFLVEKIIRDKNKLSFCPKERQPYLYLIYAGLVCSAINIGIVQFKLGNPDLLLMGSAFLYASFTGYCEIELFDKVREVNTPTSLTITSLLSSFMVGIVIALTIGSPSQELAQKDEQTDEQREKLETVATYAIGGYTEKELDEYEELQDDDELYDD